MKQKLINRTVMKRNDSGLKDTKKRGILYKNKKKSIRERKAVKRTSSKRSIYLKGILGT